MYKRLPDIEIKSGFENGNLLIVSPFPKATKMASRRTAKIRNALMIDLADEVVVAYQSPGGMIQGLKRDKPIRFL